MHVCMLLPGEFPPDIRVRKEAAALDVAGHDVTLLCRGVAAPTREVIDGIDVRRVPNSALFAGPRGVIDGLCYVLAHVNPAWKRLLDDLVDERPVDAIHVHDLPLVKTGLAVGTREGIPVIADLHENYPEAVRQWQRTSTWNDPIALVKRVLLPPRRLKRLERRCVQRADRVVTVCEEARAHYLRECGADPRIVEVVSNTVDRGAFDPDPATTAGVEAAFDPDEFVVSYVGTFGGHRGLETLVEAVATAAEAVVDIRLLLVGIGDDDYTAEIETCARNRLGDRVTLTGWVPFEDVPSYMAASDVCVVPHADTGHTRTTVPHKLFQAMAVASPLVVTDVPPLRRIVERTGCGVVVPAGDSTRMAAAFRALAVDPERRHRLGTSGRDAVERRYNWEYDAARLREMYRDLGAETGPESPTSG